ncbi:Polynucleotide 5' [Dinothrombium tinctorium]|uniref:Polynucleotide 5 n=1 Tax=Dinothrombium tinctorium TaxID=1965070 RepID=A0A3S3S6T7_9ACAR|nr:Polynucleotide 5' [Dinothrombium tinctorium]RWS11315.1 Polynucleotide 5' [Dinothrombium tinctorium]
MKSAEHCGESMHSNMWRLAPKPYSTLWIWTKRPKASSIKANAAGHLFLDSSDEQFNPLESDRESTISRQSDQSEDWLDLSLSQFEQQRIHGEVTIAEVDSYRVSNSEYNHNLSGDYSVAEMSGSDGCIEIISESENEEKQSNDLNFSVCDSALLVDVHQINSEEESMEIEEVSLQRIPISGDSSIIIIKSKTESALSSIYLKLGNVIITNLLGTVCLNGFTLREFQKVSVSACKEHIIHFSHFKGDFIEKSELKSKLKKAKLSKEYLNEVTSAIYEENDYSTLVILQFQQLYLIPLSVLETVSDISREHKHWHKIRNEKSVFPIDIEWETRLKQTLLPRLSPDSIVLVCGPKNTGKSSVIRWLINTWLSDMLTEVYYVDSDPGQSEFSPSASISLTMVDKPLLAPPFMNVIMHRNRTFFASSVGSVNVESDPDLYLTNFKQLWEQLNNFRDFAGKKPVFVNTMGWMKGIGLQLLVDIINIVKPTDLIQITIAEKTAVNEMEIVEEQQVDLRSENVKSMKSWSTGLQLDEVYDELSYSYLNLTINARKVVKLSSRSSRQSRNFSQLAYMSLCKDAIYKPLHGVTPYMFKLKDVFLHVVCDCPVDKYLVLDILNCSWVQLCKVCEDVQDEDEPKVLINLEENMCLGFGIVRSIDLTERCIYVITPEAKDRMAQVNCIVKPSGTFIPKEIMFKQQSYNKDIPYISFDNN